LMDPVTYPIFHAANQVFAQALKQASVNVQLEAMDWATLRPRRSRSAKAVGACFLLRTVDYKLPYGLSGPD
jgi:ABC-type transport system substrate-binding protein